MDRRQFLWTTLAGCVSPAVARQAPARVWECPVLGKYVGHECVAGAVEYTALGDRLEARVAAAEDLPLDRLRAWVAFPIENKLVVRFEKERDHVTYEYLNFNGSRDLVARVNRMTPDELFASRVRDDSFEEYEPYWGFVFPDPVSLVWELHQYGDRLRKNWVKPATFRLASVTLSSRS